MHRPVHSQEKTDISPKGQTGSMTLALKHLQVLNKTGFSYVSSGITKSPPINWRLKVNEIGIKARVHAKSKERCQATDVRNNDTNSTGRGGQPAKNFFGLSSSHYLFPRTCPPIPPHLVLHPPPPPTSTSRACCEQTMPCCDSVPAA